jgi:transcriptional regulator with XRE-family HTH domain
MSEQKPATRIKEFRIAAGLTTSQLGEKIGMTQSGISRIENGHVGATLDVLTKIAAVLNADVADLIDVETPDQADAASSLVSARIKAIRQQKQITTRALAEKIGTTQANLSRMENARQGITADWLFRIAKGLGVSPSDLVVEHKANFAISYGDGAVTVIATLVEPMDVEKLIIQLNTVREVMECDTATLCDGKVIPMIKGKRS